MAERADIDNIILSFTFKERIFEYRGAVVNVNRRKLQLAVPQLMHLKRSPDLVCHSLPIGLLQQFSYTSTASQSPNHPSKPDEPITGPALWEKRRAEWLAAGQQPSPPSEDDNGPGSRARARLEVLLAPNLAEEDDLVWNDTVGAIWKGLTRGDKLKRNLPLPIVIKILRGGWLRDGTWPKGMVATEDDHGMGVPEPYKPQRPPNSITK